MVALLDRIPMERINGRAAEPVNVGRSLLTLLAAVLYYGLGWLPAKAARLLLTALAAVLWGVGFAARWAAAAVVLGWRDASTPRGGG